MFLRVIRTFFRVVVKLFANVNMIGYEHIPQEGAAIVVTNHIGRLDAMLGVVLSDRDDIILMIADKYYKYPLWRTLGAKLDAIWLDR
ncbi:MAG: 1-acyl-sn-glycerol-3-phosphate acyltransferase, partial [Candidatus Promineifilaceae bacterium]